MTESDVILPGATLGLFGGGQLGRMFALAAQRMGYRVHLFAPRGDTPAAAVCDQFTEADYDDLDAVAAFASSVAAITLEFENIPAATVDAAASHAPVRPGREVLATAQNRLREKRFLRDIGCGTAAFAAITSDDDLAAAIAEVGLPAVIKTAAWGYDGKGQRYVESADELREAWASMSRGGRASVGGASVDEAILEAWIDLDCEVSVVAARSPDGSIVCFPPSRNDHANHILDVSVSPAGLPDALTAEATDAARQIVGRLGVVGVLCVEFFVTAGGELLVNELAPRPHNSGHLTINGHAVSQFEQQVRSVCGLPLGDPIPLRPAAMANLLGELWDGGEPDWAAALAIPGVSLHLYGKAEPRTGRKMGHLTAIADTIDAARANVLAARAALGGA